VDFKAACGAVGGEAGSVVFEVCSAFEEEADVVSEEDIVEAESSRGCPSVLRVLPGRDNLSVAFEGDSASSFSPWSVAPGDEDAGLVDDVESGGEGVSLEDSDEALQLRSDFSDLKDDVDSGVHSLEESDELVGCAESCEPFPKQSSDCSVEGFDKVDVQDPGCEAMCASAREGVRGDEVCVSSPASSAEAVLGLHCSLQVF
jgi:hypothetical protein